MRFGFLGSLAAVILLWAVKLPILSALPGFQIATMLVADWLGAWPAPGIVWLDWVLSLVLPGFAWWQIIF